jgi:hypothetical protein
VYLTDYQVADDEVTMSYTATSPCSRYYTRLYGVEPVYTGTSSTTCTHSGLGDGLYYFIVTGKETSTGAFPAMGPARQFFYIDTFGF